MSPSVVTTGESKAKQVDASKKSAPAKSAANISVGEFVRAVYEGSWTDKHGRTFPATLTIGWDSKEYVLEPNKDTIVPFAAVANAFGDPRSTASMQSIKDQHGVVSWVIDRPSEIRRLRAKYDNQFGDETIVETYPNVRVYTLDGDELPTVLNDQSGDNVLAANVTVSDQEGMEAAIAEQRKTIEMLLQRVQLMESQSGLAEDNTPTTREEPPKSRSKPKQPDFQVATTHEELPEDEG